MNVSCDQISYTFDYLCRIMPIPGLDRNWSLPNRRAQIKTQHDWTIWGIDSDEKARDKAVKVKYETEPSKSKWWYVCMIRALT